MIPGYDGMYEISNMGEVRSWRNHGRPGMAKEPFMLKPFAKQNPRIHGSGNRTLCVRLTGSDGKRGTHPVHLLMRDVWMKGKRPNMVVYHKNGDIADSCLHNLEYIRREDLGKKVGGNATRQPVVKINKAGEVVAFYRSAREAARKNYMSYASVLDRCHNKTKNPYLADGHNYQFDD